MGMITEKMTEMVVEMVVDMRVEIVTGIGVGRGKKIRDGDEYDTRETAKDDDRR